VDTWIVEENKKFTEFGSVMPPYHEYIVCITETSNFWSAFLRVSFSKCSMKMFAITGEIGEPFTAPEVCSSN